MEIIELINEVRRGSERAFIELTEKYNTLLISMSRKHFDMCPDTGASYDDFLQEAKLAFYKAIHTYNVENQSVTFGAYARVCVRNKLISCVRKMNSKKRRKQEGKTTSDEGMSLQDAVVLKELRERVISLSESFLSPYEKEIFSLYLMGYKGKELATRLGKDVRSVNNALYRIKAKLKGTVN